MCRRWRHSEYSIVLLLVIYNSLFNDALSCSVFKAPNHEMFRDSVIRRKLHSPNSSGPGICLDGLRKPVKHSVQSLQLQTWTIFETEISWTQRRRFSVSTATSITVVLSRVVWACTSFIVWTRARAYKVGTSLREEKVMLQVRSVWGQVCLTVRASHSILRETCTGCYFWTAWTLKMKALRSFETSGTTSSTTRRHIPEYQSSARLLISHS